MVVNGFDHILKLDFGGPGPTVVNDWLPGSFPAVHWRKKENNVSQKMCVTSCVSVRKHEYNKYTDIRHSGTRDAELVRKPLWMIHYGADLQSDI